MLPEFPAEIYRTILGILVNEALVSQSSNQDSIDAFEVTLLPLEQTSVILQASTREYRVSYLKSILAKIPHLSLIVKVWPPPLYSHPLGRTARYSQAGRDSNIDEVKALLQEEEIFKEVHNYVNTLKERALVAAKISKHVLKFIDSPLPDDQSLSGEEARNYTAEVVLHLWSAKPRYAHDVDGQWARSGDQASFQSNKDEYLKSLDPLMQQSIVKVYNALCRELRPPFFGRTRSTMSMAPISTSSESTSSSTAEDSSGGGMWLYRSIVKEGMEKILEVLDQRAPGE
jgi:hypothetical protein